MPVPSSAPSSPFSSAGLLATIVLGLGGCVLQEPRGVEAVGMPAAWSEAAPGGGQADATVPAEWWRGFGSRRLEALEAEALAGSGDLRTAAQRVRQADIALQIAGASLLPGASASAGSSASRSEGSSTRRSTSMSLNVSYEVDVWGRLAAGTESARALAEASRYDLETVRITLTSSVAATYFQLLALRERLEIARRNLATAERMSNIVEARLRMGVATPLEVSQQATTVLQQRTALAPLELQIRQTTSALALLLGRQPVGFEVGATEKLMQLQPPAVAPGLPSSLLVRRPDLRSAEARLAAASADVAAARAALLPSISLSAGGSVSSAALVSFAGGAGTASLAASLAQTIFDGGRRRLQVESSRSQREVLVETYASAIRSALKEVDDALGNASTAQRQERTQREVVVQAQRTLDLAEVRYREGADTLLTVLDAQRTLFSAQDALAQQRLTRLNAAVDLYRVLGGGWQSP
ncbi:efflux transporter outer membrane subunit [Rhizobiaceae bacterium BDR2-2]|uniref:Efflux transporter outer membrane subunit n=1 Tax=Ectorhizobium quercum TaxID=2965071 RepID=A0AAE3MYG9_9HYPH|nr:efflux transporter outer membrane subunit [Ectorhizobium quercum]MCX8995970.1 efflux transporter outer membrane subunit [Ectorhizobium quercum]